MGGRGKLIKINSGGEGVQFSYSRHHNPMPIILKLQVLDYGAWNTCKNIKQPILFNEHNPRHVSKEIFHTLLKYAGVDAENWWQKKSFNSTL